MGRQCKNIDFFLSSKATSTSTFTLSLTHVVGSITRGLQRVVQRRLLGETKVGQLEDAVSFLGVVEQVLRLLSGKKTISKRDETRC